MTDLVYLVYTRITIQNIITVQGCTVLSQNIISGIINAA